MPVGTLSSNHRLPRHYHRSCSSWALLVVYSCLHRYGYTLHDLAEQLFGLRGLLQCGRVSGIHHHAMGEYVGGERFEVLRHAEVASIQVGMGLRGAIEHKRAARRDAQRKEL